MRSSVSPVAEELLLGVTGQIHKGQDCDGGLVGQGESHLFFGGNLNFGEVAGYCTILQQRLLQSENQKPAIVLV